MTFRSTLSAARPRGSSDGFDRGRRVRVYWLMVGLGLYRLYMTSWGLQIWGVTRHLKITLENLSDLRSEVWNGKWLDLFGKWHFNIFRLPEFDVTQIQRIGHSCWRYWLRCKFSGLVAFLQVTISWCFCTDLAQLIAFGAHHAVQPASSCY